MKEFLPLKDHRPLRALTVISLSLFVILLSMVTWLTWLGWPRPDFVTQRRTQLASVEQGIPIHPSPEYLTKSVRVTGGSGIVVDFRVLRPSDVKSGPLPLVVLLGGHRTGRDAIELVGNPGPMIVVALDYPYSGPERIRGIRAALSAIPMIRESLLDTPPAVSLVLDWLIQQPWVDPDRVELAGISLGTPFATVAGASERRFRRVWLIHGGADNRLWLIDNLQARIPSRLLREAGGSLLWWIGHGASMRSEEWIARIAPRPVVIIGATEDDSLPPSTIRALYSAAGQPKRLEWTEGGHVNPRRPETILPLIDLIRTGISSSQEPDSISAKPFQTLPRRSAEAGLIPNRP